MKSVKVKKYIKLGTTVRYLIDVKEGEPLGGKYVLQNIETVLSLTQELEFNATSQSAGITQLNELLIRLKASSTGNTNITKNQSEQLDRVCRKIRESLLTEGDGIEVVQKDNEQAAQPLQSPEKVTLKWLFTHVPVPLWLAFISLLAGVYSIGVKTSHYEIVRDVFKLKPVQEIHESKSKNTQPNKKNSVGLAPLAADFKRYA